MTQLSNADLRRLEELADLWLTCGTRLSLTPNSDQPPPPNLQPNSTSNSSAWGAASISTTALAGTGAVTSAPLPYGASSLSSALPPRLWMSSSSSAYQVAVSSSTPWSSGLANRFDGTSSTYNASSPFAQSGATNQSHGFTSPPRYGMANQPPNQPDGFASPPRYGMPLNQLDGFASPPRSAVVPAAAPQQHGGFVSPTRFGTATRDVQMSDAASAVMPHVISSPPPYGGHASSFGTSFTPISSTSFAPSTSTSFVPTTSASFAPFSGTSGSTLPPRPAAPAAPPTVVRPVRRAAT